MATSATNAISMAPTLSASCSPSLAPRAAASMTLTSRRGTATCAALDVSGVPVSGTMILAIITAAGALMNDAVTRYPASTPMATYASSTLPAMVAMPAAMTANSSLSVMRAM